MVATRRGVYGGQLDTQRYQIAQPQATKPSALSRFTGSLGTYVVRPLGSALDRALVFGGTTAALAASTFFSNNMASQKTAMLEKGSKCAAYTYSINRFFRDKPIALTSGESTLEYFNPANYIKFARKVLDIPATEEVFAKMTSEDIQNEQFVEKMLGQFKKSGIINKTAKASDQLKETRSLLEQALYTPVQFQTHLLGSALKKEAAADSKEFLAAYKLYQGSAKKLLVVLAVTMASAAIYGLIKNASSKDKES